MNVYNDADVYGLITKLSKHILHTYYPFHRDTQFTYDFDIKTVKRLRIKAFEILLKKTDLSFLDQDDMNFEEVDPVLEIQKHAFVLKVKLKRAHDANTLEHLLEELEESLHLEASIHSVLQLLVQLKDFNISPEPITNIFYYGKPNPATPEINYTNVIPSFQTYPMECFILSDKFEATLEMQRLQIQRKPIAITNELHSPYGTMKSRSIIGIESTHASTASGFMSTYAFDTISSQLLIPSNQDFARTPILNTYVLEEIMPYGNEDDNERIFPRENRLTMSYFDLPYTHAEEVVEENGNIIDNAWKSNHTIVNELNYTMSTWNQIWNQINVMDTTTSDYRTWEYFGEVQPARESMFMSDLSMATIHLAKVKQMNNLPLLSEKILNSILLLEEISIEQFVSDVKSMLLGIESDTFAYAQTTGFALRRNISTYGACSESLEKVCQEAIVWGNSLKFLKYFVRPKVQSGKLLQDGLIFKAMCTNIKELLLYYQAVLLRIFSRKSKTERLLKTFQEVRPVALLITKVAKVCESYKENQCTFREGHGILTRIYNEAIKVTDTKVALVFYSLLKSCCEVYFRFLQKWMFEGICDDIYGEFMIKTRPVYLRNRDHKFWTKGFSVCNEAVPGFLSGLAESILQCGKTVRLLRICDSKNPVCHLCVTEQPEVKVCLSVTALREQSSRCRKYEEKGKLALGSIFSLPTAILNQKQLEKEMLEFVVRAQRDTLLRIRGEQDDALKKAALAKRDFLANLKEQILVSQKQNEKELSDKVLCQNEHERKGNSRHAERTTISNYYGDLLDNIDKRCIRSKWRAKRMTFHDKRVEALITMTERDLQNRFRDTEEDQSLIRLNSFVETPLTFEDENKNYTRTSCQTLINTTSDAMTVTQTHISQESTRENRRSLTNYTCETINNDNQENNFRDLLNNKKLEDLSETIFSKFTQNKNTTTTTVNQIISSERKEPNNTLENSFNCKNDKLTIERPTFLNVLRIDNMTAESQMGKYIGALKCNMTPNNNEIDLQQIKITPNTNDISRKIINHAKDTIDLNQESDLGTPMSCTTDNFVSSIQSPASRVRNLEAYSLTDVSNPDTSNSPRTCTKSPTNMKDSTFSDLSASVRTEPAIGLMETAAPLSVADVEIIDHTSLQAYLEKSIRIPLNVQSRLVNNAIIKYFLKENKLLLHLHSLRSYFFLLNGEFAKSLTDSLYARLYEISMPIELFNSATLTNLLERALVNSFNNVYINSELLSLSTIDTPAQLHISDPNALDCLSLHYKICWPLNIILDDTVMQQYGKVFKFLITSGRVSWVLQEDFSIMKRERKAATSEQYHKLQLYRHSMTQFMNALHNYLTCSVLYASWAEFEKDLENSLTVDQIYLSHVNYIKRILSRCMLNIRGEKVRICLNNIFKVILKFHNKLRSQNWVMKSTEYVHPNFKRLEQMYRAFCELRAYMAHVAFKLATSGYQPHLMHFLNALNINYLYDLSHRPSPSSSGL